MEDNKEEKKRDYTAIKRGASVVFVLAFILFNASKLFDYLGAKHTIETGPDAEGQNVSKQVADSLMRDAQKKLDAEKKQTDSLQKLIVMKDTDLKKAFDSISMLTKKKPVAPNNSNGQAKSANSTNKK